MKPKIIEYFDFEKANVLLEGFNKATGFVTAIVDLDGNLLSKSGWRKICEDFHRVNPETALNCKISDTELANKMRENTNYHFYKCMNGLIDVAMPIVIKGEHIANLFSGQFFFESPDISFFKKQAELYGFDERAYLEALEKVPVFSKEEVEIAMRFMSDLIQIIVELTNDKLEQVELNKVIVESESALLESQVKLQQNMDDLLESQRIAHLGTWRLNLETNEVVWSEELYKIHGLDSAIPPPIYTEYMKLFTPESWEKLLKALEHTRITGKSNELELETVIKDGSQGWVWMRSEAIRDSNNKITFLRGVAQDVTERKKMEADLILAKEAAEASNISKSQFLANMSHEIRTPLNGVMGMLGLLQMTELTDEQKQYINLSKTSSDTLLKLISDILDYSRIEAGKIIFEEITFSLRDFINEIEALYTPFCLNKKLVFKVCVEEKIPDKLIGDSFRLRQIISNLIGNAIKFTQKGSITLSVKKLEELSDNEIKLIWEVKDTGVGINKEKIKDIFSSFNQADNSITRQYGGTGLGLSICKGLVRIMKGEIWVESKEGEGSSFYFTCVVKIDQEDYHTHFEKRLNSECIKKEKKLTLLAAEDDLISQVLIEKMASKRGWQAVLFEDGKQAVDAYQENAFDVILMDVQMPVLDGYQATKAIRKLESLEGIHTPIIAMTAHALKGEREKCLEAGMDDYLSKPIDFEAFYAVVEKWAVPFGDGGKMDP